MSDPKELSKLQDEHAKAIEKLSVELASKTDDIQSVILKLTGLTSRSWTKSEIETVLSLLRMWLRIVVVAGINQKMTQEGRVA